MKKSQALTRIKQNSIDVEQIIESQNSMSLSQEEPPSVRLHKEKQAKLRL